MSGFGLGNKPIVFGSAGVQSPFSSPTGGRESQSGLVVTDKDQKSENGMCFPFYFV